MTAAAAWGRRGRFRDLRYMAPGDANDDGAVHVHLPSTIAALSPAELRELPGRALAEARLGELGPMRLRLAAFKAEFVAEAAAHARDIQGDIAEGDGSAEEA